MTYGVTPTRGLEHSSPGNSLGIHSPQSSGDAEWCSKCSVEDAVVGLDLSGDELLRDRSIGLGQCQGLKKGEWSSYLSARAGEQRAASTDTKS